MSSDIFFFKSRHHENFKMTSAYAIQGFNIKSPMSTIDSAGFIKKYSRLSLSRLGLSRITAYLEAKIWSLFKHRNLASGNKILWIRGEIAPQEQFLPFPTIFSISISK